MQFRPKSSVFSSAATLSKKRLDFPPQKVKLNSLVAALVFTLGSVAHAHIPSKTIIPEKLRVESALNLSELKAQPLSMSTQVVSKLLEFTYTHGDQLALAQAIEILEAHPNNHSDQSRLLRAVAYQANHEFNASRNQLQKLLDQNPNHSAALLVLSAIDTAQGRFTEAMNACNKINDISMLQLKIACTSQVHSMTGQLELAQKRLTALYKQKQSFSDSQSRWIRLMLMDSALRDSDTKMLNTLAADSSQSVAERMSLADVYMTQNKPDEAVRTLGHVGTHPGLLVRKAHALLLQGSSDQKELSQEQSKAQAAALLHNFEHLAETWNTTTKAAHERELAYWYWLSGNKAKALKLAHKNFAHQQETLDLMLYTTLALDQNSSADLRAIDQWIQNTGLEFRALKTDLAERKALPQFVLAGSAL